MSLALAARLERRDVAIVSCLKAARESDTSHYVFLGFLAIAREIEVGKGLLVLSLAEGWRENDLRTSVFTPARLPPSHRREVIRAPNNLIPVARKEPNPFQ